MGPTAAFFLVKKATEHGGLSPLRKSRKHHQVPGSRLGAGMPLSKQRGFHGLSSQSRLLRKGEPGQRRPTPRVGGEDPARLNVQRERSDDGFLPLGMSESQGTQQDRDRRASRRVGPEGGQAPGRRWARHGCVVATPAAAWGRQPGHTRGRGSHTGTRASRVPGASSTQGLGGTGGRTCILPHGTVRPDGLAGPGEGSSRDKGISRHVS